jgi:spore cortex biosynthesis protein YabQ
LEITISNQGFVFVSCVLCGVAVGFIFDLFRILRRLSRTSQSAAVAEDLIYWMIAAIVFFLCVLKVNSGELRLYQFVGAGVGAGVYCITVSKYVIDVSVKTIRFLTKVLTVVIKIILMPLMVTSRLLKRPFFYVVRVGKRSGRRLKRRFALDLSNFYKFIKKI